MLRADLQKYIDALTDPQIASLNTVHIMDGAAADAMVAAANTKDAVIAQAKLDFDTAVQKAKDDQTAAVKTVQDKLDALTKQAPVDQQAAVDAATQKAVADTTASLQPKIDTLATKVSDLQTQIAGTKNKRTVATSRLQEAALALETKDPDGWLLAQLAVTLNALSLKHEETILGQAVAKYPDLSAPNQQAVLTALGLASLIPLAVADQLPILATLGLSRFKALDVATQNAVIAALQL